jgi:hypothetical protein
MRTGQVITPSRTLSEHNLDITYLPLLDPDLALVVERWPDLPEAVRAGIVAMVKAARKGGGHE